MAIFLKHDKSKSKTLCNKSFCNFVDKRQSENEPSISSSWREVVLNILLIIADKNHLLLFILGVPRSGRVLARYLCQV